MMLVCLTPSSFPKRSSKAAEGSALPASAGRSKEWPAMQKSVAGPRGGGVVCQDRPVQPPRGFGSRERRGGGENVSERNEFTRCLVPGIRIRLGPRPPADSQDVGVAREGVPGVRE